MKKILQDNNHFVLRLDKGEEAIAELISFCKTNEISAATFSALGAASRVILAYYNLATKQYEDHDITENLEVLNITGNIAILGGEIVTHAHGTFGRNDLSTLGGHIKVLVVSATLEITLTKLEGKIERQFDNDTGLNLMV